MMKSEVQDVIWITGASSGIGKALCHEFISMGAKVIVSSRKESELKFFFERNEKNRDRIYILPLDLENTDEIDNTVQLAVNKFKKIDCLINCSGISHRTPALKTSNEIIRKIMEVNFFGTINLTNSVAKVMRLQKTGKIVVLSSIMGEYGWPLSSIYAASKFAINGYFESLRQELFKDNISVLIVSPGFINTGMQQRLILEDGLEKNDVSKKLNFGMTAEECAKKILKALSNNLDHAYIGKGVALKMFLHKFFPNRIYKYWRKTNS